MKNIFKMRAGLSILIVVVLLSIDYTCGIVTIDPSRDFSPPIEVGGVNIVLSCNSSESVTGATYQWSKDSILLSGETGQTFTKNSATQSDSGNYTCTITYSGGSTETSAPLQIRLYSFGPPTLTFTSAALFEGDTLTATCSPVNTDPPIKSYSLINVENNQVLGSSTDGTFSRTFNTTSSYTLACNGTNEYDITRQSAPKTLNVSSVVDVPTIEFSQGNSIDSGTSQTITCRTSVKKSLKESPIYQYTKDGANIDGTTASIEITSAQTKDQGEYKCTVSVNGITKESSGSSLTVNLIAQLSTSPIKENQNGVFTCSVSGNEGISSYEWNFDSVKQAETSSQLTLMNVNRTSNGKIVTCNATSSVTNVISNIAQATVVVHWLDQPLINQGSKIILKQRDDLFLSCEVASSNPAVSHKWFKDGEAIQNGANLTANQVSINNAGTYVCQASTGVDTSNSTDTTVTVEFVNAPTVVGRDSLTVGEGGVYTLTCRVSTSSNSSALKYRWFKDEVLLESSSMELQFSSVNRTDVGNYICEASLTLASSNSSAANLQVLYIDSVQLTINEISSTFTVNLTDNKNISFYCAAQVVSPSASLTYKIVKNGSTVSELQGFDLEVGVLQLNDAGFYTCTVTATLNGVSVNKSDSINFAVQSAASPVEFAPSAEFRAIKEGLNYQVLCYVQTLGSPPSAIEWFKGANKLLNLTSLNEGRTLALELNSVTNEDTDNYTCRVSNVVEVKEKKFQFIVFVRPSEPTNLDVISSSENAISLMWGPPVFNGNDQITNYTVKYGRNPSSLSKSIEVTVLKHNITGLDPAVRYHIEVSANTKNFFKQGNLAAKLNVTTGESLPTMPTNFTVSTENEQKKLTLKWEIPVSQNGKIIGYRICYILSTNIGMSPVCVNLTETTFSHLLENLENYSPYNVSVQAQTSRGFGEKAVLDNILTKESEPDQVRNAETKTTKSSRSILVSWDPPTKLYGPRATYEIKYVQTTPSGTTLTACKGVSQTQCNVTQNILPAKEYRITIIVNNTVFTSEVSITVITLSEIPPKPTAQLPAPSSDAITETTFSIRLIPFSQEFGPINYFDIIIIPGVPTRQPFEYSTADINNGVDSIRVAVRRKRAPVRDEVVVLGNGVTNRKRRSLPTATVSNGALSSDTEYTVFIRVYVNINGQLEHQSSDWYRTVRTAAEESGGLSGGAIAGILIPIIILIIVVILLLIWYQRKNPDRSMGTKFGLRRKDSKKGSSVTAVGIDNTFLPVPINRFEEHVQQLSANGKYGFSQEYSSISRDLRFEYVASRLQENNIKNRYHNIPSYDSTRVILPIQDNDPHSDYINANYIEGFDNKREYIATQGPLPETVFDFWRMIWSVESVTIVMLTKLEEKTRVKCAQYWPDSGSLSLKDFVITATEVHDFPDHVVRTFHITRTGQAVERIVKQFHYMAWPDFGVPDDPSSLLAFIRKVNSWKSLDKRTMKPTIIHCSAGVGRTGTYITIDTQIKNIKIKNDINIYANVSAIREQRCLMVQTEDQYIFIHNAILDYLESGDTEVDAGDLREYIKNKSQVDPKIGITGIMEEFIRLAKTDKKDKFFEANKNCNQVKNRYKNVYPYDDTRVRLSPRPGVEGSDYINANYIDSYMSKDHFIATQAPLESTVGDFWRMIWEQNCGTIVMLSKEFEGGQRRVFPYWPEKKSSKIECYIIELLSTTNHSDFIVVDMKLTNTETSTSRDVKQFQYTTWPESSSPEYGYGIIELIGLVQKWNSAINNKIITVHCSAGVGRTGVFIALTNLIERVKTETVVDVYQTIKKMRQQRTAMVQTRDQYEFCYRALQEYLDSFDLYANFR